MATLPFSTMLSSSYHRSTTPLMTHGTRRGGLICLRCCRGSNPDPEEEVKHHDMKKEGRMVVGKRFLIGAERVRESLRPKQKGDWKDLLLMSFSFAVYIYMSQRIVCAYCVWVHMPHHGF